MSTNNVKDRSPSLPNPMAFDLPERESSQSPSAKPDDSCKVKRIKLIGAWAQRVAPETSTEHDQGEEPEQLRDPDLRQEPDQTASPEPSPPRLIKTYRDGVLGRLVSIYDTTTREYVYKHDRDAHKPIRMTFLHGKIESLQDADTGKFIYQKGVTHIT
ncbi:hypothetical protein F5Y04DRAFT_276132 [Hypomontagnella monticulosa]|nr:hypothetical protein F5Y04DRAFT_276132 [Hypomontagnella monticulosa]